VTTSPASRSNQLVLDAHPSGGETTLYLVRHGRTDGNVQRRLHGSTDMPLDLHGLRQAERVANRLAAEVKADVLLTSPLSRARTTADTIAAKMGLEVQVVPGLVEMNFGDLEGLTLDELAENYPDLAAQALDVDDDSFGWPNGESRLQFHLRVKETFERILRTYANHLVIVVAHGGVLGSLLAQAKGTSPNDWRTLHLANCSLSHVDFRAQHTVVQFMNDSVHLAGLDEPDSGELRL
jgi:broad specificity phosphatase PhoE